LKVANAIWAQQGFDILPSYLDTIALNYGAGVQLVDFVNAPSAAVSTINTWVEKQTNDKIKNLLSDSSVNAKTRLVLTNAVYFDASWAAPFNASYTSNQPFTRLDGSVVSAPTMSNTASYGSYQGGGVTAVSLPYAGNQLSMLIIQPDDLTSFEASLTGAVFDGIVANLKAGNVILSLPKWNFTIPTDLKAPLSAIGMSEIFNDSTADFSGIDGQRDLVVQDVVHKAYIDVDEAGTEAAAATAVIVGTASVEVQMTKITIDQPFVFAIRDEATGAVVFLGRVIDPTASQ
jgi:serpin B